MSSTTKSISYTLLLWLGVLSIAFGLQLLLDDMVLLSKAWVEQLNTFVFGLATIFVISTLQFSGRFPVLFETRWYLFHIIICAFSYLIYNALFIQMNVTPEAMLFVQKSSSFGSELIDKVLGNGIGIYSMTLLIFSLVYQRFQPIVQKEVQPNSRFNSKIKVKLANKTYFLPKEDILFIRSANNYSDLYTENGKHVIRTSIGHLEKELDPSIFIRIHRSIIIRLDEVMEFISTGNGDYKVKLKNEETFNIGNKYKPNVIDRFGL